MNRLLLAVALVVAGCGDARPRVGNPGNPSDSTTRVGPTGTTQSECAAAGLTGLTYSNFGQAFATAWCTRCHSPSSADRHGAPLDHNFNTYEGIQQFKDEIDQVAAMNPTGSQRNNFMPITDPVPPDDERKKLACWIATGLAQ
ncbi:MAG: hypothetical protein ACJ79R_18350 [Anaeromyxobacteraceae bacterium]